MGVFIAKQGDIMSHWGSVGVIARSVGLNGAYWGLAGGQWDSVGPPWGSLEISGAQCVSVGLSECQLESVGLSVAQLDSVGGHWSPVGLNVIYTHRLIGFILIVLWYILFYLYTYIIWNWVDIFVDFTLQYSNKSFRNNRFSFKIRWINFQIIVLYPWIYWSIPKFTNFIYPYFIWFTTWLTLKPNHPRTIYAYLLKNSISHNKNQTPLLYLLITYISATSTLPTLVVKRRIYFSFFHIFWELACVIPLLIFGLSQFYL